MDELHERSVRERAGYHDEQSRVLDVHQREVQHDGERGKLHRLDDVHRGTTRQHARLDDGGSNLRPVRGRQVQHDHQRAELHQLEQLHAGAIRQHTTDRVEQPRLHHVREQLQHDEQRRQLHGMVHLRPGDAHRRDRHGDDGSDVHRLLYGPIQQHVERRGVHSVVDV